jgi:hypothetical protein
MESICRQRALRCLLDDRIRLVMPIEKAPGLDVIQDDGENLGEHDEHDGVDADELEAPSPQARGTTIADVIDRKTGHVEQQIRLGRGERLRRDSRYPPAIAPTTRNGSAPVATASGNGASGDS